ncbi:MAG: hypothetical protein M5U26_01410 [Planctomycetota bacterium]|nr:hypothetical protein [Planctomycetota bacterium]
MRIRLTALLAAQLSAAWLLYYNVSERPFGDRYVIQISSGPYTLEPGGVAYGWPSDLLLVFDADIHGRIDFFGDFEAVRWVWKWQGLAIDLAILLGGALLAGVLIQGMSLQRLPAGRDAGASPSAPETRGG